MKEKEKKSKGVVLAQVIKSQLKSNDKAKEKVDLTKIAKELTKRKERLLKEGKKEDEE